MGAADDEQLLDAWQAGDATAGEQLFERHFAALHRFFRSKVDDASAEDLTQACFEACAGGRDAFRRASSFRTFLFGIARNQLYGHFRKRRRQEQVIEFGSASVADLGAGPATMLAVAAEKRLLLRALQRVPVEGQVALELYYWEGLSTRQVAEVLDVAEGTARSRLTRARDRLRIIMAELAEDPALVERSLATLDQRRT